MKCSELLKKLKAAGWVIAREGKGSHKKWNIRNIRVKQLFFQTTVVQKWEKVWQKGLKSKQA